MVTVHQTNQFSSWLKGLKDNTAQARILVRIKRFESGNFGDSKSVGDGIFEARFPFGPGYRVYYLKRGEEVTILLCGGDKSSQEDDIRKAKVIAKDINYGTDPTL